jgi:hypothetical protein
MRTTPSLSIRNKLSSQIPESYAANAFNVFQQSIHQFEIVRLCALWDSAELEKENIPTVVGLIDDAQVLNIIFDEVRQNVGSGLSLIYFIRLMIRN